ncbi:LPS biosynthesis protein [Halorubrum sp. Ea1]|uniref:glycosyltransferase family 4 protein n=1 Tax=Halorubrum sp. Ea1 TaxID=1480718 RepID=UPI000B998C3D|nr:glycosyltransferase family 4 protein [Halorubrum sp. Ea1]OYR53895.1 LPS biosynthesis protein [Halorubrum sp. Ea1]
MVDNIRILRVANSIYPEVVGGVGLHVHHMSRLQAQMGHEVTILTSDNGDHTLPRQEFRNGYNLLRHNELFRPLDNSITPRIIQTLYNKYKKFDILHIHSHLYASSNIAAVFARLGSIPAVVTNHGLISQTAPHWLHRIYNPTLGKFTFESAEQILCYTDTDKARLEDRDINTDISVISNGIDCAEFKPRNGESGNQLLFVGRLKEGKGPKYLLRAFSKLTTKFTDLKLKIVGDGPLKGELEAKAVKLNISNQVEFLGEIPNERLPKIYDNSSVFVLPSFSEGLPRTVLEAMACSTPVVVTNLPQLQPIVEGAGITVDPGNSTQLFDAAKHLLNSPEERAQMGKCGREKIVENYSWRNTVERTTNIYRDILRNSTKSKQ